MRNTIQIVAALAVIIGAGLVHGSWTNRWRMAPVVAELAGRLEAIPTRIGPWEMTAKRELPPRELAMTGAAGYVSRVYTNSSTGQSVSVLLLTGLPGDITTHTPDACYPGAGYVLGSPDRYLRRYGQPERSAEFKTAVARREGTNPSTLRLFWSWRNAQGWAAPDDARWFYAVEPVLSKLYVVRETGGTTLEPKEDPCNSFLAELLPALDRALSLSPDPVRVALD
jgi:hypothetical protein